AIDVFERKVRAAVVLADLMDLDDVRVLEPGRRLGLRAEALALHGPRVGTGQDHLQGDDSAQRGLAGLVDYAHAAAAQRPEDHVTGDGNDTRRTGLASRSRVRGRFGL